MTPLGRRRTRRAAGPIDQTGEVTNDDGVIDGAEDFVGYIATRKGSVLGGQAEYVEDVA